MWGRFGSFERRTSRREGVGTRLENWRGSQLQTVYKGIEIGTQVGKYQASVTGLRVHRGIGRGLEPTYRTFKEMIRPDAEGFS